MANIRTVDVISTVEAQLIANWPDSSVTFVPSASDGPRPSLDGTVPDVWAQPQWISFQPQQMRAGEDWTEFDMRLRVYARTNDRLAVEDFADDLRDLMRDAVWQVLDRDDGSTAVGWVRFVEIGITPAQKDARDVVVAVVDVVGWAHAS